MPPALHSPAPDFTCTDHLGEVRSLRDWRGRWVLLYFYPKDDTPGCTKEACELRDASNKFAAKNCAVVGVSINTEEEHVKFVKNYKLPFTLLADPEKNVVELYGVWREKHFMGKTYMGTVRTSFLIDPAGNIAKVYEGVDPEIHAREVVKDLERLQGH